MISKWFKQLVRSWRHHTTMQVATLTVLVGSYTVVTLALLVHQNLQSVLTQWGENVEMSIYLEDDVKEQDISKIKQVLGKTGVFKEVAHFSKDEAIKRFNSQMAGYVPALFTDSEFGNPLPASLEVQMDGGLKAEGQYDHLVKIASGIEKMAGVDEVSYGQGWVENYASVVEGFSLTSYMLVIVLLSGSLFVVGNSIRNSISQRKEEIEVLELVGATKAWIRSPYIFEGVVTGVLAGLLALVSCYLLYAWQASIVSEKMGFWSFATQFESLSFWRSIFIVTVSGGFGALGSYLCVSKLSSGWAAAQANEGWSKK